MTQQPATESRGTGCRTMLVPPDERFWVRYSPHHEFPLSTVTSVALHVLAILLLLLGAWVAFKLGWLDDNRRLPVVAVVVEEGGGNGPGPGPGRGEEGPAQEDVPGGKPAAGNPRADLPDPGALPEVRPPADKGDRPVPPPTPNWRKPLGDLGKALDGKLGPAGPGKDRVRDVGVGDKNGPGSGEMTRRRMQRWTLIFNTDDGADYARQLDAFRAILVYPDPDDPNEYRVIHDLLARPVKAQREDITQIRRMFWVDEKERSVASLARALGIKPTPPGFAMFFAPDLEGKLLKLELTYRGRTEEEIDATDFEVFKTSDGYDIRVIRQTLKRR
jgi:hypothetical protein